MRNDVLADMCDECGGPVGLLGYLGHLAHYQCHDCGMMSNRLAVETFDDAELRRRIDNIRTTLRTEGDNLPESSRATMTANLDLYLTEMGTRTSTLEGIGD